MKKAVSLLLALSLCLGFFGLLVPQRALAADADVKDGFVLKNFDYINLGSYAHIDSSSNYEENPSAITWMVVDADPDMGTARLVSRYVLDQKYLDENAGNTSVTAIYSPLAGWLTGDFKDTAFSSEEQSLLMYYDSGFYSTDENNQNYAGGVKTRPGTQVSFVCFYADCYFKPVSSPLGIGQGNWVIQNMQATYKDGVDAPYWAGTTSAAVGGNHIILNSGPYGYTGSNSNVVSGVRPMIKINLEKFSVTGSGTATDPYVVASYGSTKPPLEEWSDPQPKAELSGKTLTLSFADKIEVFKPEYIVKYSIGVKYNGIKANVTSIKLENGKLVVQLAEYIPPSEGPVTVSYDKPDYNFFFKMGTRTYVPSFKDFPVTNLNDEAPPQQNQPGFSVNNIESLQQRSGAVLASDFPAWGGHQSRLVRTSKGVYIASLINSPSGTHKFGVYKVDEPTPVLIGEEFIAGVSISLVSDRADNLYVVCLDTAEGDAPYGRATAFKYTGGQGPAVKIQYQGDEFSPGGGHNYEGVSVDGDGNIIMAVAYVNNDKQYASKLTWLTLDTETDTWGEAHSSHVKWSELYIYALPKPDGTTSLVSNVAAGFTQMGYDAPLGLSFSWFGITLWNIPDLEADAIDEIWRFDLPFSADYPDPLIINNYWGDAYVDTKGYTHVLLSAEHYLGLDAYPKQMRYVIFDENNEKILDRKLFDGGQSCRFVETPDGDLYILKMTNGTSKFEVYAVNEEHTNVASETPIFVKSITNVSGDPYLSVISGITVTSVRGGNSLEHFVDVAFPIDEIGNGIATDWITFRFSFPQTVSWELNGGTADGELVKVVPNGSLIAHPGVTKSGYALVGWYTDADFTKPYNFSTPVTGDIMLYAKWKPIIVSVSVSNGNGQANVDFAIWSANGMGYSVYLSETGIEGPYKEYSNVNYNSKGAHIKGLENGKTYYVYIQYSGASGIEKSDPVILSPSE